jgi:hypothetical protein
LADFRADSGLDTAAFAERMGLLPHQVSRLESNSVYSMRLATLKDYLRLVGAGELCLCAVTPDGRVTVLRDLSTVDPVTGVAE